MFSIGAGLPLVTASVLPANRIVVGVSFTSLLFLGALGGVSAQAGGAKLRTAILRVTVWGALAMAATALVGTLLGVSP
jgi:VIT1/CCC1 family predicted Fe2+/Mn2+ transporter